MVTLNCLRAILIAFAATPIIMAPLHVTSSGWWVSLTLQGAAAKDGNGGGQGKGNGDGTGGDNGKGRDNGGGNGNGGDKGGGNGNGGNNGGGKGNGGANSPDRNDAASTADRPDVQNVNPATNDRVTIRGRSIEVVHRNGMRESVKGGRYLMQDDQGRTIIERAATKADLRRLRKFEGSL